MTTMAQAPPTPPRRLLKANAAATYLGITRHLLFQLVKEGRLTDIQIGRNHMFPVDELDEILRGTR